jgi:hypothetical protein
MRAAQCIKKRPAQIVFRLRKKPTARPVDHGIPIEQRQSSVKNLHVNFAADSFEIADFYSAKLLEIPAQSFVVEIGN